MSKVVWLSPSPLWGHLLPLGTTRYRAPTVLRFASDAFMEQYQALLEAEPGKLRDYVARYETWRKPAAGLTTTPATETLKLFQPIQGRFYLVTASLACRTPGLPDHTVDVTDAETVSFVLRRATATTELAWVTAPDGTQGWTTAQSHALAPGEETLPMFATNYVDDDLTRRVFAGLVPVGRREAYVGGRTVTLPAAASGTLTSTTTTTEVTLEDPRVIEFQRAALEPWLALRDWYRAEKLRTDVPAGFESNLTAAAEQASALILLDFATYLSEELTPVFDALGGNAAKVAALTTAQRSLYDALDFNLWSVNGAATANFRTALLNAHAKADDIEAFGLTLGSVQTVPAGLPARLLTGDAHLTDIALNAQVGSPRKTSEQRIRDLLKRDDTAPEEAPGVYARKLKQLVMKALAPSAPTTTATSPGFALSGGAQLPLRAPLNAQGDDLYVIRCVYQRPHCGKGHAPLVSSASEKFRLASFFDPDAPQRAVRVSLPIDTSPAGLRKFDKNVGFLLSNELRKQMSRVKGLKELMDGEVQEPGGLDISVICSFSIPIITICALILLMIIVSLLNFIFWWIPFLMMCFPVPSLKAKPANGA